MIEVSVGRAYETPLTAFENSRSFFSLRNGVIRGKRDAVSTRNADEEGMGGNATWARAHARIG